MFNRMIPLTILALMVTTGCAIDRSVLATPESLRDLPPPPEVVTTDYCSDVSEDAGVDALVSEVMTFDAAEQVLDAENKDYFACIVTTKGIIELTLFDDNAPITVNNFVFLANEGFYDGVPFHRVIEDFMAQVGDRNGFVAGRAGTDGPGYSWNDELPALTLNHAEPGILSMANAGPNTNGSQIFITHVETPWLDGLHAIFGQISGEGDMDVLLSIAPPNESTGEPVDFIRTVEIIEVDES